MRYASKSTECEAMLWNGKAKSVYIQPGPNGASDIVAWVNANGGEAKYVPVYAYTRASGYGPAIVVRTINGWAYATPGHYVVMGTAEFTTVRLGPKGNIVCRDFYPCDPETFDRRWVPASD